MALKTYDLKDVICTYGPHRFKGFDEGSAITLTPVEDIFKEKVGADGETTRARTNNNNYEASIKLMGNSSVHLAMINSTFRNSALNGVTCLLYTYPSPRDGIQTRMPSSPCNKNHSVFI